MLFESLACVLHFRSSKSLKIFLAAQVLKPQPIHNIVYRSCFFPGYFSTTHHNPDPCHEMPFSYFFSTWNRFCKVKSSDRPHNRPALCHWATWWPLRRENITFLFKMKGNDDTPKKVRRLVKRCPREGSSGWFLLGLTGRVSQGLVLVGTSWGVFFRNLRCLEVIGAGSYWEAGLTHAHAL